VLVTSRDIINLWVARYRVGPRIPRRNTLSDVIIHATIMDDEGKRMSKSKGTGVDPLELIDAYGADALRSRSRGWPPAPRTSSSGRSSRSLRVEMSRNFVTKLWNASRFAAPMIEGVEPEPPESGLTGEDRWILSRLTGPSRR